MSGMEVCVGANIVANNMESILVDIHPKGVAVHSQVALGMYRAPVGDHILGVAHRIQPSRYLEMD